MTAKTKRPTQDEMKARIARFKDLKSTKAQHGANKGIPPEVLEMITAKTTFNIMSPAGLGRQLAPTSPVIGGDAGVFRLSIVTCPPGNGPGLHVHWKTHETFMALSGKWEVNMRTAINCVVCVAIVAAISASAVAQTYPARPIRLVVPFPAGGTADVIARSIANEASAQLGQSVVFDNRGGANSIIGTEIVAKAPPDGYTLLYVTAAFVINPHVYLKLPYDALRDFDPITNGVLGTGYLVVLHPAVPANSVKELVALARDGKVSYSSPGVGNTLHLAAELFATRAGVKLLHVPYKGVAPALNAVLAGEVQMTLIPPTISVPMIKAGRAKAIAFTGSSRFPGLPQLPTMTEAGIPNLELTGAWHGWFAPAKTPPSVIARLHQEIAKSLHTPRVREAIVAGGYEPDGRSPAEFRKFLRLEYERYAEMVRTANLQKSAY